MTVSADLEQYLRAQRARIDAKLAEIVPAPPACPPRLSTAMRYSLFGGGKRLRPVLALASAEAVVLAGKTDPPVSDAVTRRATIDLALPAACAVELIHTYSLVHDDLPAMDDDTMRRGRPTSHVVYGEGLAILAGDALLTEAFALLAREPVATDGEMARRKLQTIAVIATAAGATGMVGGQVLDLEATGRGAHAEASAAAPAADELRHMHACKTGALIRASAVAGAIMAGGVAEAVEAIGQYAAEIGLAFQIMDDLLDVEASSEQLGKTAGKDVAAGKLTYPALYGVARSRQLATEAIGRAQAVMEAAGLEGSWLPALASWVVARAR